MVLSTVDVHKFFCTLLLLFLGSVLYRFVLLPRLTGESIMKGYVTGKVFPFLQNTLGPCIEGLEKTFCIRKQTHSVCDFSFGDFIQFSRNSFSF